IKCSAKYADAAYPLPFSIWHLAFGFWLLAFGFWHLAFGIWHLAFGIDMITDLRFAARMLLHSRGFSATAFAVLTLGIGATTTMFSATNAILLKPLPYPDPARIFVVRETRA